MSETLGNVRGIPPVDTPGKFLKSNATFGIEWGDAGATLPPSLANVGPIITDFNAPKANGWYRANNAVNGPPTGSGYGLLMHQEWDGNNGHSHQIYYQMYGTTDIWARACVTYVWQAWFKISPIDDVTLPSRLQQTAQATGDWNTATKSGFYRGGGAANAPTVGVTYNYFMGWVSTYDEASGHVGQLVVSLFENLVFWRHQSSGVWSAWAQIFPINDANLPKRLGANGVNAIATDGNNVVENGWYYASPSCAHMPSSADWHLFVYAFSPTLISQEVRHLYSELTYRRTGSGVGGSWSPWKQVYPVDDTGLPARLAPYGVNFIADCNTFMANGWGYTQAGLSANTPYGASAASGPWGVFEAIFMNGTDNGIQRWWQYGTENRYERSRSNATWGAWQQTWPLDAALPARLAAAIGENTSDANLATKNGWYGLPSTAANKPPGSTNCSLEVIAYGDTWLTQTAHDYYTLNEWRRICQSGSWSSWVQTWPVVAGGGEIHYSQRTTNVALGSNTPILAGAAVAYDGTPVMIEFFASAILFGTSDPAGVVIYLVIDGVTTGVLGQFNLGTNAATANIISSVFASRRWTIPAGSHTVSVMGSSTTGANTILAEAGDAGGRQAPCYLRITKA